VRRVALRWASPVARLLVGAVLVHAGTTRLTDPLGSVAAVQSYDLLPSSAAETVGYVLPALQVVIGVALLAGLMSRGAAALAAVVFLALVVATTSAAVRGIDLGGPAYVWTVARDVVLLALSLLLVRLGPGRFALDRLLLRRSPIARADQGGDRGAAIPRHDLEGV
jgi:uncharacterized membrane protein YphA (DoxX/SURF4 family)